MTRCHTLDDDGYAGYTPEPEGKPCCASGCTLYYQAIQKHEGQWMETDWSHEFTQFQQMYQCTLLPITEFTYDEQHEGTPHCLDQ